MMHVEVSSVLVSVACPCVVTVRPLALEPISLYRSFTLLTPVRAIPQMAPLFCADPPRMIRATIRGMWLVACRRDCRIPPTELPKIALDRVLAVFVQICEDWDLTELLSESMNLCKEVLPWNFLIVWFEPGTP